MKADEDMFFRYYRMSPKQFDELHSIVRRDLRRNFEPGPAQWEESAQEFSRRWNFSHCVGAVDGKHVQITAPPNSGSSFFNYKDAAASLTLTY
ncbi:uncharacterized protein LOC144096626 isoform X2 [Amblyomma americanum]